MAGAEQTCIKRALDRCEKGTDFSTLSNTDLSVPWVPTTSPQCWVLGRSRAVCQEAPEGALRGPVTGDLGQAWRTHRLRAWQTGGPQGAAVALEPEGDGTWSFGVPQLPRRFPRALAASQGPRCPPLRSPLPHAACGSWGRGHGLGEHGNPSHGLQKRSRLLRPRWPQEAQAKTLALVLLRGSPELGLVILSLPKTFRIAQ